MHAFILHPLCTLACKHAQHAWCVYVVLSAPSPLICLPPRVFPSLSPLPLSLVLPLINQFYEYIVYTGFAYNLAYNVLPNQNLSELFIQSAVDAAQTYLTGDRIPVWPDTLTGVPAAVFTPSAAQDAAVCGQCFMQNPSDPDVCLQLGRCDWVDLFRQNIVYDWCPTVPMR